MKRLVLPVLAILLVALIVADRMSRIRSASAGGTSASEGTVELGPADASATPSPAVPATAKAPVPVGTPTVDRLARLAVRHQLGQAAGRTYLDSLIATTDSVVRRWPDRGGAALRVFVHEGGVPGYAPRMGVLLRQALGRWTDAGVGVRFVEVLDTAAADIVVRWIERFEFDRAGQTDLTWDQLGRVRRASISLAIHTSQGSELSDAALLAVAVHELGHAIGLPHSADSADVMFPSTRTVTLSDRDIETARLLYQLPPGSVRDAGGP